MRPSGRLNNELREVSLEKDYTIHAEGSVLVSFGQTRVLCNATIEEKIPPFVRSLPAAQRHGWIHAEYGMLPRSTGERMRREAMQGKPSGRTMEIQRLIARALRAAVDLKKLGERSITIDCDVIQADGGTRTASITGGFVALSLAVSHLMQQGRLAENPIIQPVASVSVGMVGGQPVLDLDYVEDSNADTDMNLVMTADNRFIEVQGTAEAEPYTYDEMQAMLALGQAGIRQLIQLQQAVLNEEKS